MPWNPSFKVIEAILKWRKRPRSLTAARKCVRYSYPESVGFPVSPSVEEVPCEGKLNYRAPQSNLRADVGDNQEGYIVVYHLPTDSKSSEDGLSESGRGSRHPRSFESDELHAAFLSYLTPTDSEATKHTNYPGPVITTTSVEKLPEYPSFAFSKEMYKRIFSFIGKAADIFDLGDGEDEIMTLGATTDP